MKIILTFLLLFIIVPFGNTILGQTPKAVKGVLDLRQIENKNKFIVSLNGEWEFYWKKMLYPHYFEGFKVHEPDLFGVVPSYWIDYSGKNIKTEKFGYATYHLIVLLPKEVNKRLALDVPVFDSSFDLWVNDTLLKSNGQPGKSEEETKPEYSPGLRRYTPKSDTLSIVINVSNYHHRRGGFWLPMRLGTFAEINKKSANKYAGGYATMSIIGGFALFFLVFFILYPKDRIMAFFSMALIGLALRPMFTSQFLIYDYFQISWQWTIKLEYICLYIVMIGWAWFAENLYPSRIIRIIAWMITSIFSLAFILTLFLPVKLFSYATLAYYPSMLVLTKQRGSKNSEY